LAGGLAGPLGTIRNDLLSTLAELEAGLDFVEEDIEFITPQELTSQLDAVKQQLEAIASQISNRDVTADSAKVVLVGAPNSGKSSLFNALAKSNQAIVTDVAGTTTDFISAKLIVDSAAIELIDTAGFEHASEQITQQAQSHRAEQEDQAHVRLFCIDRTQAPSQWEWAQLGQSRPSTIVVLTKTDLLPLNSSAGQSLASQIRRTNFEGPIVHTSCVDLTGLDRLRDEIAIAVLDSDNSDLSVVSSTVLRASESLRDATDSVQHALDATHQRLGEEIVSAEIRRALEGLGQVVGTVYTDDILDLVFGRFCIGK
jgi:tRNA modification GTPase